MGEGGKVKATCTLSAQKQISLRYAFPWDEIEGREESHSSYIGVTLCGEVGVLCPHPKRLARPSVLLYWTAIAETSS